MQRERLIAKVVGEDEIAFEANFTLGYIVAL
jgi:hypothetical protein